MLNFSCDITRNLRTSLEIIYPVKPSSKMICVEVGSFEGRGSILICDYLCTNADSKLYCIDPLDDEYVKGDEKMAFWNSACVGQLSKFRNNISYYPKIYEHRGTSDNMIPRLDNNSIDFVYIDGDHSPEQVYKDAVNMFAKMKDGGVILFDDYLWEMNGIVTKIGVDKFLEEYKGKYELLLSDFQLAIRRRFPH